jgi:hypothetical protein
MTSCGHLKFNVESEPRWRNSTLMFTRMRKFLFRWVRNPGKSLPALKSSQLSENRYMDLQCIWCWDSDKMAPNHLMFCYSRANVMGQWKFYVLWTRGIILLKAHLAAQFFFSFMFIPNLYMFQALMCSSSGELIVSILHLVYVTVCRWLSGMQVWVELQLHQNLHTSHLHRVTYTRCRIDTINSPDDEHMSVWST